MCNCAILEKETYSEPRGTCTDCILHAIAIAVSTLFSLHSNVKYSVPINQSIHFPFCANYLHFLFIQLSSIARRNDSVQVYIRHCKRNVPFSNILRFYPHAKPATNSILREATQSFHSIFSPSNLHVDIFSISRIESVRKKETDKRHFFSASSMHSIPSIYFNSEYYGKTTTNRE